MKNEIRIFYAIKIRVAQKFEIEIQFHSRTFVHGTWNYSTCIPYFKRTSYIVHRTFMRTVSCTVDSTHMKPKTRHVYSVHRLSCDNPRMQFGHRQSSFFF